MEDLSLHVLDVAENAIAAGARKIDIEIEEETKRDRLTIRITDDGPGMDAAMAEKVLDPFVTTRKDRRVGLGLPLLAQTARESGGDISIDSEVGGGTRVVATFGRSHIDRRPLGDMARTIETLVIGNPTADFSCRHWRNGGDAIADFDAERFRAELGPRAASSPEGIRLLREHLRSTPGRSETR